MNRLSSLLRRKEILTHRREHRQLAFSTLYERYAALLLGVITKIVHNETEALSLLETTFRKVHVQIAEFQPEKQPQFVWLLTIARHTAVDALKKRKSMPPTSLQQLSASIQAIAPIPPKNDGTMHSPNAPANSPDSRLNELLDRVLFKNCTPEEAAASLGIPAEMARQQLRLAVQRVRDSQQK